MADSKERLYFVRFEFICGEHEQTFGKAFYAEDEYELEAKIDEYLKNYYGKNSASEIEGDIYYYLDGEVGLNMSDGVKLIIFKSLFQNCFELL